MTLKANHHQYEIVEVIKTFTHSAIHNAFEYYRNYGRFDQKLGTLLPELVFRYNGWLGIAVGNILAIIAVILTTYSIESGLIYYQHYENRSSITGIVLGIIFLSFIICITALLIHRFADIRYLLFQGDKVILQSRALGRRVYKTQDLKFHLIKIGIKDLRYHLEVELPDPSIVYYRRMLILETAVSLKTMDGLMATLFPLMRGDPLLHHKSVRRKFEPLDKNNKPSLRRKWINIEAHIHVWFLNYTLNRYLFWLVHGSRAKIFKKEAERATL